MNQEHEPNHTDSIIEETTLEEGGHEACTGATSARNSPNNY